MGLSDEKGATNSIYQPMKSTKGGYKAAIFVFALTALENVGFFANMVSIVLYCATVMHFDLSGSANTTTNFLGTAYLLSLVGGAISDSFMNRLNTSLIFGGFALLGYVLLIIQSHDTKLQPEACGEYSCVSGGKAVLFYASLYLAALGGGGMRGSVPALGGDQFDQNDPKEKKHLASYFNYLLFSITCGACIGVTIVVWVSENRGWYKGFLISLACLFLGLCLLAMGKPFYRVRVPAESTVFRVLQVLVVTIRNLRVKLPENPRDLYEKHGYDISAGEEQIHHSKQFRLLDKAAVLREGDTPKKWRVCTVTQVEEVKVLTRMMPIIFSTIIMNTCLAQLQTFTVQQGVLMNTKIGTFKVPPASIPFIPLAFMTVLIPIYDIFFVPIMRKFTGHPGGITHLQRVGVGLVLCVLSMSIAGVVEVKRKNEFKDHNERISLFWLAIHYGIFGLADMFTLVGLLDFFYSEAPKGMRSLSTSFAFLSLSFGYFLSTVFVDIINSVTSNGTSTHRGWLDGLDLNKDHLEYFYWFLAVVSLLNFGNYVFWASWYKYKKEVPTEKQSLIHRSPSEGGNGSSASKPHEVPTPLS